MKKSLGIIRKFDNLGRIVVPKEVRKAQGWDAGTAMEMFMDGDKLVLGAYKPNAEKESIVKDLQHTIAQTDNVAAKEILENTLKFIQKG
jgi:AbrB family looped-hinge helix DNA binding protein